MQTVVVVAGVGFALVELNNALDDRRHARFEVTATMLNRFAEAELVDGANALLDVGRLPPTPENYNTVLARLTPLRQHYITWSACFAEEICTAGPTRDLFCQRLIAYENALSEVMAHFGRPYDRDVRATHYFGQLELCDVEQSDWVAATF